MEGRARLAALALRRRDSACDQVRLRYAAIRKAVGSRAVTGTEDYQRVAALADVPEGGCLAVEVSGCPVVLIRQGSAVSALENRCPHAGAPLSEGFLEGGRLTCSWHGWTFDATTGASLDDPSLGVPAHSVRIDGGEVFVKLRGVP